MRQHVARHRPTQRLKPGRPIWQRQLKQRRSQTVRQRLPDGPSRQPLQVVGHRVDQHVAGTPELVEVTGAELAGSDFTHTGSICSSSDAGSNDPRGGTTARPAAHGTLEETTQASTGDSTSRCLLESQSRENLGGPAVLAAAVSLGNESILASREPRTRPTAGIA